MIADRVWALVVVVSCLLTSGPSAGASESRITFLGARGMVAPVYLANHSRPSAVLRIERVQRELERRGPFRIGLLPYASIDHAVIEILHPDASSSLAAALERLDRFSSSSDRVRIRHIRIVVRGNEQRFVQAERIHRDNAGKQLVLENVTFGSAGHERNVPRARMSVVADTLLDLEWRDPEGGDQKWSLNPEWQHPRKTAR